MFLGIEECGEDRFFKFDLEDGFRVMNYFSFIYGFSRIFVKLCFSCGSIFIFCW